MSLLAWPRRATAEGVAAFAKLAVHVFFRELRWSGLERIPGQTPLVLVANHNNSVVDSILLLALPRVRPRMLAKSTLFTHPVMGPLVFLAGALRVYRRRDPGVDVRRNTDTFSRCHEVLTHGGAIALFPEGMSHNQVRQLPLKSGAARIVLGAESRLGPLGVRIVPVGLHYDEKDRFRSTVSVHVGEAIDPRAEAALYAERPSEAVRALTDRIALSLEEAVRRAGAASGEKAPGALASRRPLLARVLAPPVLAVGYALNWLPYRLPGWVAGWLARSPDDPATYKLLTGALAFPVAWTAEGVLTTRWAGPAWGLLVSVAAPVTGYVALRLREAREGDAAKP